MRRVGASISLAVLLASWLAPAALGSYASPLPLCCRRGGHHCPQSVQKSFRDARLHCQSCQSLVSAHQAPKLAPLALGLATHDEHPFVHEFSSAFSPDRSPRSQSQRAPPAASR